MVTSISFHLVVSLLLVLVHQHAAEGQDVFNFDDAVGNLIKQLAEGNKEEVDWWDMHGAHSHLQENSHKYKEYKVTLTSGPVKYGNITSSSRRPSMVYTQWAHNGQSSRTQKITVKRSTEHKKTATWNTERTFRSSLSLKVSATLPEIASFETQLQTSLDLKSGTGGQHVETETFSVDEVVEVPPMKSLKIEWIITDVVQQIPWTATVNAKGWIAVWYKNKVKGHWLWFYPVSWLKHPLLANVGDNTVQFTATGVFTAVNAQEAHLRVTEYDLQEYGLKPSGVKTYPFPLRRNE